MNETICTEYFAGCNTGKGFINYLPFALEGVDRVFILKGSPGSGKSSMMKKIASEAESSGIGVERIFCSSDPNSLDGIIMREVSAAVIDGTAPHTAEANYPGAVETIINLGEFWDSEMLRSHRDEIMTLSKRKSEHFTEAYLLLSASDKLRTARNNAVLRAVKKEKMEAAVGRLFSKVAKKGSGTFSYRLASAFGTSGLRILDTFKNASDFYYFSDKYGISSLFISELLKLAAKNDVSVIVSPDPFDTAVPAAVCFTDTRTVFLSSNCSYFKESANVINTERFIDKSEIASCREKIKFLQKCVYSVNAAAAEALGKAKEAHMNMEQIYSLAMDFSEIDSLVEILSSEIFF